MPAPRPAPFSSEFLAQLERLTLLSRRTFRGRVRGERRSPRRGHSVEFCDYRAYGVGDDLRYVDWNIYGRLNRLHVKLFVDEEDLCLHLLLDASASMDFGTPTKPEYGARLAAALGFIGLVSMERVGVGVLRERVAEGWPPTRGRNQVVNLFEFLSRVNPAGGTSLNDGLGNYAMRAREPGLAVVISDLMDPGGFETGVRALLERRLGRPPVPALGPPKEGPGAPRPPPLPETPARAAGAEPVPVGSVAARPRGVRVFPAAPARSAADPSDPGPRRAVPRAGPAGRHPDGRWRPQGRGRARHLGVHEGARRQSLAVRRRTGGGGPARGAPERGRRGDGHRDGRPAEGRRRART